MIDIDDGLALNTLKTLKSDRDQAGDLILESGNQIEDEARVAAPGSAPFPTYCGANERRARTQQIR